MVGSERWPVTGGAMTDLRRKSGRNHSCAGIVGVIGSPGANTCVFSRRVIPGRGMRSFFGGW